MPDQQQSLESRRLKALLRSQLKELNALVRDREATPQRVRDQAEAVALVARRYEEGREPWQVAIQHCRPPTARSPAVSSASRTPRVQNNCR